METDKEHNTAPTTNETTEENNVTGTQKDILIVYYSRSGSTKKVAEKLAKFIDADTEEITTEEDLSGAWGYLKLCYRATMRGKSQLKNSPEIKQHYKTIWIGGPVHAYSLSSPLLTWIDDKKEVLKQEGRQISLFGTEGGMGHDWMFSQAENIIGVKAVRKLVVNAFDVENFDPEKSSELTGINNENYDNKEENKSEEKSDNDNKGEEKVKRGNEEK